MTHSHNTTADKPIFGLRVHTGKYDSDGEICVIALGARLEPDGEDKVWVINPDGSKLFHVSKSSVEQVDEKEIVYSMMYEAKLQRASRKSPVN